MIGLKSVARNQCEDVNFPCNGSILSIKKTYKKRDEIIFPRIHRLRKTEKNKQDAILRNRWIAMLQLWSLDIETACAAHAQRFSKDLRIASERVLKHMSQMLCET